MLFDILTFTPPHEITVFLALTHSLSTSTKVYYHVFCKLLIEELHKSKIYREWSWRERFGIIPGNIWDTVYNFRDQARSIVCKPSTLILLLFFQFQKSSFLYIYLFYLRSTLTSTQRLLLDLCSKGIQEPYAVSGIKLELVVCKIIVLTLVLSQETILSTNFLSKSFCLVQNT